MNDPDKRINVMVFNAEGFLMNDHHMEVLQNSYQPRKLCQTLPIHDSTSKMVYGEFPVQYRPQWSLSSLDSCRWSNHHKWGLDVDSLSGKLSISDSSFDFCSWPNWFRRPINSFHRGSPTIIPVLANFSMSALPCLIASVPYRPSIRNFQL
jgi:hypothetical protein